MTLGAFIRIVWFGIWHLAIGAVVCWVTWLGVGKLLPIPLLCVAAGFLTGSAYFWWIVLHMKKIDWNEIP